MKQIVYYILFILPVAFLFSVQGIPAQAQSSNQNYILTKTYVQSTSTNAIESIRYYDGLGRPVQTVQKGPASGYMDIITRTDYDDFGRLYKQYLPGKDGNRTGNYRSNFDPQSSYGNDAYSYSETQYEASPLNRIDRQYGPGNDWRTASRSIWTEHLSNTSSGVLACYNYSLVTYNSFKNNGYYAANQLFVTKTTNENNNISYEFVDKLGRIILQRQVVSESNYADTYYIYNDFGNLVFVLPPEASKKLTATGTTFSLWDTNYPVSSMCYFYEYNDRQHLRGKVISDAINFYAPDKTGRIILEQTCDAPSDLSRGMKFYKYDKLGRLIISGIYKAYDGGGMDLNSRMADARGH